MIKIIEKAFAGKYYCPVSPVRNERCHGDACMKWETKMSREAVFKEMDCTKRDIYDAPTHFEDFPTSMGWCGL